MSKFASLWIDQADAKSVLGQRVRENADLKPLEKNLVEFIDNGFTIIESAVSEGLIDQYLADFERLLESKNSGLLASVPVHGPEDKAMVAAHDADRQSPLTKYLDTFCFSEYAKQLSLNYNAVNFLKAIFEELPLCFQSLHFERGSTQAIHQDTAYVVVDQPLNLAASWIALEDVQEGSGELAYYPGSHRFADHLYSSEYKHFNHERDPHQEHLEHLESLHTKAAALGLQLRKFNPKKGDMLIWHADLAHGGLPIENPALTRRSYVSHYCGLSRVPNYVRYLPEEKRLRINYSPRGQFSTMYY
ncbi:MAG: phytanoyl-CoA dioxygenase family protein [Arenimonas sp.]